MRKPWLLALTMLLLPSCQANDLYLEKDPNTNLELWLTEEVRPEQLEALFFVPGGFGAEIFINVEPLPGIGLEGIASCVLYTISAYPDYAHGGNYVTGIDITDPDYVVYGLTVDSSEAEFASAMERLGFPLIEAERGLSADWGNGFISFELGRIKMRANVSNRDGIVF